MNHLARVLETKNIMISIRMKQLWTSWLALGRSIRTRHGTDLPQFTSGTDPAGAFMLSRMKVEASSCVAGGCRCITFEWSVSLSSYTLFV